jgi:hypothetical protein
MKPLQKRMSKEVEKRETIEKTQTRSKFIE